MCSMCSLELLHHIVLYEKLVDSCLSVSTVDFLQPPHDGY